MVEICGKGGMPMRLACKLFDKIWYKIPELDNKKEDILGNYKECGFLSSLFRGFISLSFFLWGFLYVSIIWVLIILCVFIEFCIGVPVIAYVMLWDLGLCTGNVYIFIALLLYSIMYICYKLGGNNNESKS